MLEADALHRVVQLDIDAEIIGIELELVAFPQPAVFIDIHGQGGDRPVAGERPVFIVFRTGFVMDLGRGRHDYP